MPLGLFLHGILDQSEGMALNTELEMARLSTAREEIVLPNRTQTNCTDSLFKLLGEYELAAFPTSWLDDGL